MMENDDKTITVSKICRTCLSTEESYINFFNFTDVCDETKLSFYNMLFSIAFIQIHVEDGLPDDLCQHCAEKITSAYNFKLLCEKSDSDLRKSAFLQCIKFETELEQPLLSTNPLLVRTNAILPIDVIHGENSTDLAINPDELKNVIDESFTLKPESNSEPPEGSSGTGEKKKIRKRTIRTVRHNFRCSTCGEIFESFSDLRTHKKTHPADLRHNCHLCDKSFSRVYALQHHLVTHTEFKAHLCPVCGKQFHLGSGLRQHLKYHRGIKPHACELCQKKYYNLHLLKEHIRCAHSNNRYNIACTICNKKFTAKSTLTMHMKVHTGERSHECTMCGKRFTRGIYLRTHFRQHTQEPPPRVFLCSYENCGRMYTTKSSLDIHVRHVHTRERPFTCDVCNKSFCALPGLTEHRRIHTGEKPEECSLCRNRFVNKQSLKKHMRLHTGERPYQCPHCEERFISSSRRNEHVKTKHMERQEECPICHKRFHLRRTLKGHLRIHSGEKQTQSDTLPRLPSTVLPMNETKQNVPEPGFEVIV